MGILFDCFRKSHESLRGKQKQHMESYRAALIAFQRDPNHSSWSTQDPIRCWVGWLSQGSNAVEAIKKYRQEKLDKPGIEFLD